MTWSSARDTHQISFNDGVVVAKLAEEREKEEREWALRIAVFIFIIIYTKRFFQRFFSETFNYFFLGELSEEGGGGDEQGGMKGFEFFNYFF